MGEDTSTNRKDIGEAAMYVKEAFRSTLRELLGPSGLNALEHYLNRRLQDDMYDVLVSSPPTFYNTLRSFLGKGADAILRIVVMKLIEEKKIVGVSTEEFIELMKSSTEESYRKFLNSFRRG